MLRFSFLVFALLPWSVPAQHGRLSVQQMQQDFDLMQKALEEVHGGIYRYADKTAVEGHFTRQRARINHVNDKFGFISIISETLAGLRDGHLRLEYDAQTVSEVSSARLLPLTVALESGKAIVVFNETSDRSFPAPGMELVSVNGVTLPELISLILPKVSGDGFNESGRLWRIERNFATYYWLFINQQSDYKLTVKDASGAMREVTLAGVTNNERTANRTANPVNSIMLKSLPPSNRSNIELKSFGPDVAYVSVLGFQGSDFKTELDTVFHSIKRSQAKSVILDLRGNGGGVDDYGAYLVSQFVDKPFRYFDHIHLRSINPSFTTWKADTYEDLKKGTRTDPDGGYLVTETLHPGVGVQHPANYSFAGKLIVLMNGGTFSTAADVTATLHGMKRGIFVGEESGGGYEGNTSGLNARLNLPNSGLSMRISLYDYWNAVDPTEKGRGTVPQYFVEDAISNRLRGSDEPLKKALELVGYR